MVTFPRTASLSTPEAKESSSEERLLIWQFPQPSSHDFLSLDPLIQWVNDHFTKEATKVNCPRLGQSVLNVPQHASARSTKNLQCHGVDRQDPKGWLGLEACHHRFAVKVKPAFVPSQPDGPRQVQPYSLVSRPLELNSESL